MRQLTFDKLGELSLKGMLAGSRRIAHESAAIKRLSSFPLVGKQCRTSRYRLGVTIRRNRAVPQHDSPSISLQSWQRQVAIKTERHQVTAQLSNIRK